jgi:5-methylcytosine-specific restriction enzyme A
MTRSLLRACLDCKQAVRGKPRCRDCQARKDRAKAAKRPDLHNDAAERRRRREAVADHRSIVGDWCPGWQGRPAHPSADLTADHVREVAAGGRLDGPLVVRCRACNTARSMHIIRRFLTTTKANDPSPAEPPITHRDGDGPGPVAA